MKVLCALNPAAAGGTALQRWPQLASFIESFNARYELLADQESPISEQLLSRLQNKGVEDLAAIAGIGGDGTHFALVNALMRYSKENPKACLPPYALIPLGTANDIAKSFGLRAREDFFVSDLRRAVSTIFHGADYKLDLGLLNDSYFVDAFTIGLDPRILRERNVHKSRLSGIPLLKYFGRGYPLYAWCTGVHFLKHKPFEVVVRVDGMPWYSGPAFNLIINNTRIYAGEFDFCADAYGNDGLLDAVVFTGHRDYLTKYLLAIRHNPQRIRKLVNTIDQHASHTQGKQIDIQLADVEPAQLDGEEIPADTSFRVTVVPAAIHIKTPAEPG